MKLEENGSIICWMIQNAQKTKIYFFFWLDILQECLGLILVAAQFQCSECVAFIYVTLDQSYFYQLQI